MQTITINWQDDNSIKRSERRKAFLENKGYTLIETTYRCYTMWRIFSTKAQYEAPKLN